MSRLQLHGLELRRLVTDLMRFNVVLRICFQCCPYFRWWVILL